jgi:site-specific recombinase XerD
MEENNIDRFLSHLRRRNYAGHTIESYGLDLRLFFTEVKRPAAKVTWREVDRFVQAQHRQELAPATINRRLHALKVFFDFLLLEERLIRGNPVKPSHYLRQAKTLPKKLTNEQLQAFFAQIHHPLDRALFLLMLRCGLRVSEVARLKLSDIDWEQQMILIEQGKGRKDRRAFISPDALAVLRECQRLRPAGIPHAYFFWNRKRQRQALSIKAIQKKMERMAAASGVTASCHSLRHTFASNLLEEGAEIVSIKEFLGHSSVNASERYARLSNRKLKEEYLQTMRKIINRTKV